MDEAQKRQRAERVVAAKLGFIRHAIVYVMVIAGLAVINNLTGGGGYQWWLWPAFGWGLGLVANFIQSYVFRSGDLQKRLVEREMGKLDE
jgi:hypothetical protein